MKIYRKLSVSFLLILSSFFTMAQKGSYCPEDLIPKYGANRQWGYANLIGEWVVEPIYTKVSPYVENKAVVMKGLLYGVIDCEGNIVLSPQYEMMTSFRYGKVWAKQKGLWLLVDGKGTVLLPPQFSEITPIPNTEFTWVKKDSLWGLINEKTGRFLCKPQYPVARLMSENATLVEVGGMFGVINHVNCQYLIQPKISNVKKIAPRIIIFKQEEKWGLFSEVGVLRLNPEFDTLVLKYNNLLEAKKNNFYGLYDLSGKEVLPVEYDSIGAFSEGYFLIRKNNKMGYVTRFGKIFIAPVYDDAEDFQNKMAVVKKGSKYGVIDIKNKFVLSPQFSEIHRNHSSGYFAVKQKDAKAGKEKYFFYDENLKKAFDKSFDTIYVSDSVINTRVKQDGKYFFYNVNKKSLNFPKGYDYAEAFKGSYAIVGEQGKMGVINIEGKEILNPVYDTINITSWGNRFIFLALTNGLLSTFDVNGKAVLKDKFHMIHYASPGVLKVRKDSLYGIFKTTGEQVASLEYSYISGKFNSENVLMPEWPAIVKKQNKLGLINEKGEEIAKVEFNRIDYLGEEIYALQNNKYWIFLYSNGNKVVEDKYEAIGKLKEGLIAVKKGKKWGYIDKKGSIAIPFEFQEAYDFSGKCAVVKKGAFYTVIDPKGKVREKSEFSVYEFDNGKRKLTKDGKTFLLNDNCKIEQIKE